jgi:hypothetical protein
VSVFSYYGWCAEADCREAATKRAQVGMGCLVLMVPLCEEHLGRFVAEVGELREHELGIVVQGGETGEGVGT